MKLLSPILLGLGLLSAATASDNANHLRANTSARQLSTESSGIGGGTWMWYFMLNVVNGPLDLHGGEHSCGCNDPPLRCGVPHIHSTCSSHSGSGGGGSGSGGSGGGGGSQATSDGSSASSSYSNNSNNDDGSNSSYNKSANDDYSGENDDGNNQANYYNNNDDGANGGNNQGNDDGSGSEEDQYLEYNEYNGGNGNANQITGGQSISVWPILIAAIVIGAVAAALVATKKVSFTFANKVFTTCCEQRIWLKNIILHLSTFVHS